MLAHKSSSFPGAPRRSEQLRNQEDANVVEKAKLRVKVKDLEASAGNTFHNSFSILSISVVDLNEQINGLGITLGEFLVEIDCSLILIKNVEVDMVHGHLHKQANAQGDSKISGDEDPA